MESAKFASCDEGESKPSRTRKKKGEGEAEKNRGGGEEKGGYHWVITLGSLLFLVVLWVRGGGGFVFGGVGGGWLVVCAIRGHRQYRQCGGGCRRLPKRTRRAFRGRGMGIPRIRVGWLS